MHQWKTYENIENERERERERERQRHRRESFEFCYTDEITYA